jgi:hypothetical protein
MDSQNRSIKKVRETSHERIPKLAEVSPIPHFFSKDISGIDLAGNMKNLQHLIFDPFLDEIFTQFDVTSGLVCQVVRPFRT